MRRRISASSGTLSVMSAAPSPFASPRHERDAREHQRQRQQRSHGQPAPQEAELWIGLAKMFADRARDRVAEAERAQDETRSLERAGADQRGEQHEQQQAFERRLVELARVARQRPSGRKHHPPRQVGRASPKLAVDEIGDAAEEDPDRSGRASNVAERKYG